MQQQLLKSYETHHYPPTLELITTLFNGLINNSKQPYVLSQYPIVYLKKTQQTQLWAVIYKRLICMQHQCDNTLITMKIISQFLECQEHQLANMDDLYVKPLMKRHHATCI